MTKQTPILAASRTAAALLDMREPEFLGLVRAGHLPGPVDLGGFARWDVDRLRRIATGSAAIEGEMEW